MLKIDLHTHTIASRHAFHTLDEMAKEAKRRGVEVLGITDHGPAEQGGPSNSYFRCGRRLPKVINGVRLLFGVEANILDKTGKIDLPDKILKYLDIVIAGLHKDCGYNDLGRTGNTNAIIEAMKNPFIKMISHPYNMGVDYDVDIEEIARASCKLNKILEVNSSFFYAPKSYPEKVHDRIKRMVAILKKNKKKTIINSDAHNMYEIGRDEEARAKFDYLGLTDDDLLNNDKKGIEKHFGIKI
ncbi:MAG: PHP domain-containing protein [Patescibacteria group bacterium]